MDYKLKLKEILWENDISGRSLIDKHKIMSYDHYKKSTTPKRLDSVIWVKAFVIAYEMGLAKGRKEEKAQ